MRSSESSPGSTAEPPSAGKIDVHAHFVPDFYRKAAEEAGFGAPDAMPGIPRWSLPIALDFMDSNEIEYSLLSISSPGIFFGDDRAAAGLARRTNEYAAHIVAAQPRRFGFFAILPMATVEGALAEIEYCSAVLKPDGFVIMSNHAGLYPGDSRYEPVFAELGKRAATVFIHPTSPCCSCASSTERPYPRPMLEFMFESTRVITNLILTGTTSRHRDLNIIIPHGGATISVLADRIAALVTLLPGISKLTPAEVFEELRRLYFDCAGAVLPRMLPALVTLVGHAQLLYGSDWPHTPNPMAARLIEGLAQTAILSIDQREALWHANAARLFPRLSTR